MNALQSLRSPRTLRLLSAAALLAGLLSNLGVAPTVQAAALTVTTTADELNADGDCSLREAVRAANLDIAVDACARGSGADTITLPAGTYTFGLTGVSEDAALTGDLDLTGTLTITGAGAATTIIDGGRLDRVFHIQSAASVTINAVTIRNGVSNGGGIVNAGTLTLNSSVVSGNRAGYFSDGYGGGIVNRGTMTLTDSTVSGNLVESDYLNSGGGIANDPGATLTITRSSIRDNTVAGSMLEGGRGGGIHNRGTLTVTDSTVSGNFAKAGYWYQDECPNSSSGGGMYNGGTLTLINSTISGNTSEGGGCYGLGGGSGITNEGAATLTSNTITANQGNGITNGNLLNLRNTIVAGNTATYDLVCDIPLTSQGYNLIGHNGECTISGERIGDLVLVNPLLGPLSNNGGPTLTHALLPGSPAVDAGSRVAPGSGGNACPATDQRGVARPLDGNGDGVARCDIGALERQDNLVLNGGFELDSNADGTPDAWSASPQATRSNAAARSGTYALRHQASDNSSYTVFSDPVVPITAGQSYRVSGFVNIPATSDAFSLELQVRWRDAASTVLSTVAVQTYSTATGGWASFTATLVAPANATQATIRQAVTSLNATLYVDDLSLQPVYELVLNGGFEADTNADGTPDAWSADPRATRSNAAARSGTYALRHQASDDASYTVFSDPVVPAVPLQTYSITGSVNIPATSDAFSLELQVRWRDAAGTVLSTVPVQIYSAATSGWTSFTATVVAPREARQATIRQAVTSLNATIYVDDLRLRLVDNVMLNGSFELDSNADGTPDGWSPDSRVTRSNVTVRTGKYVLQHQASDHSSYTVFSDPVGPVVAGQTYSVSAWVITMLGDTGDDTFSLEFQVRWRDAAGTVLSTVPVQRYSTDTYGWTNFAATLVAPPNATQATIRQVVTNLNNTLCVDNLVFGQ